MQNTTPGKLNLVTIGGGKGQGTILSGLKDHQDKFNISAIVSMVDNGGSTGKLRKEIGIPPFGGDFRDVMTALSDDEILNELFHHRYEHGKDVKGHTVGNLVLLGLLEQVEWDIPKAIELVKKILKLEAEIYPSTLDQLHLVAKYGDGTTIVGQDEIDNNFDKRFQEIEKIDTEPVGKAYEPAAEAIRNADLIVLCPGDIYGSLLCNLVIPGIGEAIGESKGKIVYVVNLMTKVNQTHGWPASRFIEEISKYIPRRPDYAIVNNQGLTEDVKGLDQYKEESWEMVESDITGEEYKGTKVLQDKIWWEGKEFRRVSTDVIPRSFIRHDPYKIAKMLLEIA